MAKEKGINSSLLDKAIVFAVNAHKNVERRGKGFPYIAHPLEAMSIVASMTNDQELLAAACLHDVLEDTDITYEELKNEFGQRVADLVLAESDKVIPFKDAHDSWVERKQCAIDHLANAPRDVQMVALGDKLSNMRALYRDYKLIGDELWNRFHVTDPRLHAWHYRGLAASLSPLAETDAYQEFVHLMNETFTSRYVDFSFEKEGNEIKLFGEIDKEAILKIKKELDINTKYVFDFLNVYNVNFSGTRGLLTLRSEGYSFIIRNAPLKVASRLDVTGASNLISVTTTPKEYTKFNTLEQSGDGYTALTYWTKDNDAMVKIYYEKIPAEEVEKEKRYSVAAAKLGIPTPLSGDLLEIDGKNGIIFERIQNKVSFARAISHDPSKAEELGTRFARLAKKLHSTKCDKSVFPNAKESYVEYVKEFKLFSDEEKEKVIKFILDTPDADTCLHGDFHFGNAIITSEGEELFIDMGDFSYGHPNFDLGTLWYFSHNEDEEMCERMFHTSHKNLLRFYEAFIKEYFDNKLSLEAADKLFSAYSGLTVLWFAHKARHYQEWMYRYSKRYIIDRR